MAEAGNVIAILNYKVQLVALLGVVESQMIVSCQKDPKGLKWVYDSIIIFTGTFKTQYEKIWCKLSSKGITVYESLEKMY